MLGYMASEEYASRLHNQGSAGIYKPLHSNQSQPHVESPLRKASFPVDAETNYGLEKKDAHSSRLSSENALESETEDEETNVSSSTVRKSKIHDDGYDPPTEALGSRGGKSETENEEGFIEERGYGVPILASDEVAKTPGAEYQQPAVSPAKERGGSNYYSSMDSDATYQSGLKSGSRSGSASNSRPGSRPASVHSLPGLSRFSTNDEDRENMHTPLEDVDEYEPLFPDEEGNQRPVTAAERLKLREQMKRFPSKDIWEDTPNSLQLQATVETPEPFIEQPDPMLKAPTAVFETPEQESARKGEVSEAEKAKLIPREERLAKSHFKPHLREETRRPGLAPRFPSRDIWEDSPDSARLETTVGEIQVDGPQSPPDEGLEAGAIVQTSGRPNEGIVAGEDNRECAPTGEAAENPIVPPRPNKSKLSPPSADPGAQVPPSIPARPPRRVHQVPPADAQVPIAPSKLSATSPKMPNQPSTEARKARTLPDRSKPQVPTRPARPVGHESSEAIPLAKVTSALSTGSGGTGEKDSGLTSPPAAPKPKPAIPARPAGGKIASLKAGFLSDLDSRLKLGPQGPKPQEKTEPEVKEEKAPLADARKSRAKGPVRRKPVAQATTGLVNSAEAAGDKPIVRNWQMQAPWTIWEHDGALKVGQHAASMPKAEETMFEYASHVPRPPASAGRRDGAEDAEDMQQARLAVEKSLTASDSISHKEVHVAEAADGPTQEAEETEPVKREPSPTPSSPLTVVSPAATEMRSRIGEEEIAKSPESEAGEKATGNVRGEEQVGGEGTEAFVENE